MSAWWIVELIKISGSIIHALKPKKPLFSKRLFQYDLYQKLLKLKENGNRYLYFYRFTSLFSGFEFG